MGIYMYAKMSSCQNWWRLLLVSIHFNFNGFSQDGTEFSSNIHFLFVSKIQQTG